MRVITTSDLVDYRTESCPYCGELKLYLEFDEWDAETGAPTETGVHVHCENEDENDPHDHCDMPYVNWLPVQVRAYKWCIEEEIVIADDDDHKRLADWNAGNPLPGGMR